MVLICSNQQSDLKTIALEFHFNTKIAESFEVLDIDKLEFTSGGDKKIENHKKCDSLGADFYRSYFLIDEGYAD